MAPYHASSFDSHATPSAGKCNDQEEVIFSLTDRLRDRESEIRHLSIEKSELENKLILRGNDYEELLTHLKQREDAFRSDSKKHENRLRELEKENRKLKDKAHASRKLMDEQEKENRKLKDKVHASRKLMDEQEKTIQLVEKETDDELKVMSQRLEDEMRKSEEKNHRIIMLEDMVESLTIEVEESKKEESEDKELIVRLGERVENYRDDQNELERMNVELQNRVETQCLLLKEKNDEIVHVEIFRDQREDELNDDIDRMRHRLNEIIQSQRIALDDKEEEIQLLYRQTDRYDQIIDDAEYVTHEQRSALKANKREIADLSRAIEKVQNNGLLSQLDKMCSSNSREAYRETSSLLDKMG